MNPNTRHELHAAADTRRKFLRQAAALAAAAWIPGLPRTPKLPAFGQSALAAASSARKPVLVVLELAGGNDGLNTVVPRRNDTYLRARGELAITDALALDDSTGLHPSLAGLAERFQRGQLAIIEGVGYPEPQRSHFLSRDIWHTADMSGRGRETGWLGRLADAHFAQSGDPNAVLSLGTKVPYSCRAEQCRAIALTRPAAFRVLGDDQLVEALDTAVAADDVSDRAREFLKRSYMDARRSSDAIRLASSDYQPRVNYPSTDLADDLRLVASLIAGGLETRVFALSMGGFDTHTAQADRQGRLLAELDGALDAFLADLEAGGLAEHVAVMVHSEFGRRVAANASGGTDHGTAGPVFVAGSALKGGRYGAPPNLEALDERGDVQFTTDFRTVYASLIEEWIGVPAAPVLGGSWPSLGLAPA